MKLTRRAVSRTGMTGTEVAVAVLVLTFATGLRAVEAQVASAAGEIMSRTPLEDGAALNVVGRGRRLLPRGTTDVWAHRQYAYLGTGRSPCGDGTGENGSGIRIFDVRTPARVREVGVIPSVEGSWSNDVKVRRMNAGDILVHSNDSCDEGPGGFEIWNVANPLNPVHLAHVNTDDVNPFVRDRVQRTQCWRSQSVPVHSARERLRRCGGRRGDRKLADFRDDGLSESGSRRVLGTGADSGLPTSIGRASSPSLSSSQRSSISLTGSERAPVVSCMMSRCPRTGSARGCRRGMLGSCCSISLTLRLRFLSQWLLTPRQRMGR